MERKDWKQNWQQISARIKAEHPDFTDEELQYKEGREVELVQRLADKRKQTKEEIYNWLSIMG